MTINAALYVRVSNVRQETENQLLELRRYAAARGWAASEFIDRGYSGSKTEDDRPSLKRLMIEARLRRFDIVAVWAFDRFARSMVQLVGAMETFSSLGIAFVSLREGIDSGSANGRLIFGIFASLAQFERELIRERVFLGLQRAKAAGKRLGRPSKSFDATLLLKLKRDGLGVRAISQQVGLSTASVSRYLKREALQNAPTILSS